MNINVNRINQSNGFSSRLTRPNIERSFSAMNMSHTVQGTGDMGYLIPIHYKDLIPGQKVSIKTDVAIQFQPFVSNLFHELKGEVLTYFVPYRIIWEQFEEFIMGGKNGENTFKVPQWKYEHLRYQLDKLDTERGRLHQYAGTFIDTLIDKFGLPVQFNTNEDSGFVMPLDLMKRIDREELLPKISKLPFMVYNQIYNDHIRIPDYKEAISIHDNIKLMRANWFWDYFTRARPFQQRGNTPTVPLDESSQILEHEFVSGRVGTAAITGNKIFEADPTVTGIYTGDAGSEDRYIKAEGEYYGTGDEIKNILSGENITKGSGTSGALQLQPHNLEAMGINLNDFLYSLAIMRYQINNARIEYRYKDQLQARFGVLPQDMRLDMAEYIGREEIQIGVDLIAQTSPGDETKQGNMTGQAWGRSNTQGLEYEVKEHGMVMSLLLIRPANLYEGGIPKEFTKEIRFDFPTPELVNTPDREVKKYELGINLNNLEENQQVFGWQGIYEEYRTETNFVTGILRPSLLGQNFAPLKSYTLARYWNTNLDGVHLPELGQEFIECIPDKKRIVQYPNEPTFIYFTRTTTDTAIPLPVQSEPAELANI